MKKAQSAMEFLTTYGWALLIVALVMSTLVYYGVFDIERMLPEKCSMSPDLRCQAFSAHSTGLDLYVVNGLGYDIVIKDIKVEKKGDSQDCIPTKLTYQQTLTDGIFTDGMGNTITLDCSLQRGDILTGNLIVSYGIKTSEYESDNTYQIRGVIRATIS